MLSKTLRREFEDTKENAKFVEGLLQTAADINHAECTLGSSAGDAISSYVKSILHSHPSAWKSSFGAIGSFAMFLKYLTREDIGKCWYVRVRCAGVMRGPDPPLVYREKFREKNDDKYLRAQFDKRGKATAAGAEDGAAVDGSLTNLIKGIIEDVYRYYGPKKLFIRSQDQAKLKESDRKTGMRLDRFLLPD